MIALMTPLPVLQVARQRIFGPSLGLAPETENVLPWPLAPSCRTPRRAGKPSHLEGRATSS